MDTHCNERPGGRNVFRVEIAHRQHNSWQGRLYWVNEDKRATFRSALELLMLINNAVDTEGGALCGRFGGDNRTAPGALPATQHGAALTGDGV